MAASGFAGMAMATRVGVVRRIDSRHSPWAMAPPTMPTKATAAHTGADRSSASTGGPLAAVATANTTTAGAMLTAMITKGGYRSDGPRAPML